MKQTSSGPARKPRRRVVSETVQPVLDAIARTAARLCEAHDALIHQVEGNTLRLVAKYGRLRAARDVGGTFPLRRGWVGGRAVIDRKTVHVHDLTGAARTEFPGSWADARVTRVRTALATPLLRNGTVLGTILIRRTRVRPFTAKQIALLKTFADQAAIAIENARLSGELKARNRELTEALEQQTSTSAILRVISSSPTDVQPVLEAVIANAVRLAGAKQGHIRQYDGEFLPIAVHYGEEEPAAATLREAPLRPTVDSAVGRAFLQRVPVHIPDVDAEPWYQGPALTVKGRTVLAVPMLREGVPIGTISMWRDQAAPFSDRQIELVTAFADQAVIAIENVRLFTELEAKNRDLTTALDQQTATSEILRVISSSPTDVQPVFDTIARSSLRLLDGHSAAVRLLVGDELHVRASTNTDTEGDDALSRLSVVALSASAFFTQVVQSRTCGVVDDMETDPRIPPEGRVLAHARGFRSGITVPMLREESVLGVINVTRREPGPFSREETALLKTFADQAVIAIENVRLFKELEAKNRALTTSNAQVTEALDRQTATADVLRIIARSPTELQPVLDAIAASAVRLCAASDAVIERLEGDRFYNAAHAGTQMKGLVGLPLPLTRRFPGGRAVLDRRPIIIDDIQPIAESEYPDTLELLKLNTVHSCAEIPLLSEGRPLGNLAVLRAEVRPFTDAEIALLQTFADQAVIAIENVRLFTELEARNHDLTEALDQQTATSEILQVISSSPTNLQPVLEAVAANAARVCGAYDATVLLREGDFTRRVAHHGPIPNDMRDVRPLSGGYVSNRAILEGRPVHVHDILSSDREDIADARAAAPRTGYRTLVAMPLLREGEAIGALTIRRREVQPFTDKQLALLRTFADQAVIAIENVRLFKELEARNRDLTDALQQRTATGEILRVISRSPTDVQPVFDAIVQSATRLCEAAWGAAFRFDGRLQTFAAGYNLGASELEVLHREFPRPLTRDRASGRAIADRRVVHVADLQEDPEYVGAPLRAVGFRTVLAVPMLRDGEPIGVLGLWRREARPFTEKQIELVSTFADQAVIAVENVRLFTELDERNRELRVALEQQTATSELLKVIGRSTFDLQPVFETLAENAVRLCEGHQAFIFRFDGQLLRVVATHNISPELKAFFEQNPVAPGRGSVAGRAALDRRTIHIEDVRTDPEYTWGARQVDPIRTVLTIPMLRAGEVLGVIGVNRLEVRAFSDNQIALLETFADQAAIAIENARLLTELQAKNADLTAALEQQTATGEILRVISSSPTDIQPVLDAVAESAARLCRSVDCQIFRVDGDGLVLAAHHGPIPAGVIGEFTLPLVHGTIGGRTVLEARTIHVADILAEAEKFPEAQQNARRFGMRTMLSVPLIREGAAIGVIQLRRAEVDPFTDRQAELLKIFADQAVIAIENVRLFQELGQRNAALTEALERQTATSEILRVISSSPSDVQPVFDAISKSAVALCDAQNGTVVRFDGQLIHVAAHDNVSSEMGDIFRRSFPRVPNSRSALGRSVMTQTVIHVPDLAGNSEYEAFDPSTRTVLAVPMLKDGSAIGAIGVARVVAKPFTDNQIALLQTFADQAVIAIENARLLGELRARTAELTRSVDELTALGEVSRALSSTLDLETVLSTIVGRANELAGTDGCTVWEYDESSEEFVMRATSNIGGELGDAIRANRIRKGEGALGMSALSLAPTQIPDIAAAGAYHGPHRDILLRAGHRALLAIPLLREDHLVGGFTVSRKSAGEFSPVVVGLLQTFATQSALAIHNARLFREIADKSRQLELASRHKSQFLANMSHELRTPLNAILGYSELIADNIYGEVPERMREVLERVDKSGRHLLGLINDILDLSKIEAGQLTLALTPYSMDGAAQTVATAVGALAAEKQLGFEVVLAEDLPIGQGDERRLTQVLLNLVGNAIKFTEVGKVVVRVATSGDTYVVSVIDTGPGIAEGDREKIFEEFQQADTTRAKAKGGTGLGLAISRRIVEMHGGRLWVESTLGEGSTFSFTVPIHVEQQVVAPARRAAS
jgi:GAF domain-containing protein